MPALEDGEFDQHGHPMKTPLTPPLEPVPLGLALNGLTADAARCVVVSQSPEAGKEKNYRSITAENSLENGTHSVPMLGEAFASPQRLTETRAFAANSSGHSNTNGTEPRLRRGSSDLVLPVKDRRLSKQYWTEQSRELSRSPNLTSLVVLSPTLSDQTADPEPSINGLPRPLLPVEEGQILQTRSPSMSDASCHVSLERTGESARPRNLTIDVSTAGHGVEPPTLSSNRPRVPRALSTPASIKSPNSTSADQRKSRTISKTEQLRPRITSTSRQPPPSPVPAAIPMPPLSLSTYLQLELSSQRPSPIFIHRSSATDFPYESSRVKIERLLNFLFLPPQLEGVLWFGVLACLDVWLYTFTILPLRMIKSIYILSQSFAKNSANEARFVLGFVYAGTQRVWQRRRTRGQSSAGVLSRTSSESQILQASGVREVNRTKSRSSRHHRRAKSTPSNLMPDDKADILKGLLIIATCAILLRLDASRMYHWVRGQAAIKLYVIYNLLEVCDRLLSALGQDVLECLFSREALERKPDGHSKVLRPLWLFLLALVYCVIHSTALFYQVVTLNVAVNSYSNALITLLMSNQFVEIKGTVFKKFERENLFQITCADIVERFQLWHMLIIIASRNIVETGGLTIGMSNLFAPAAATATSSSAPNVTMAVPPLSAASFLPSSFMIVPSMLSSVTSYVPTIAHVLGPFIIVLGSEMFIDWLKHAYIGKFNNTRPVVYGRFLDILAKDYYTNAFGEQNLTKRLGLPVIPLCCLMIRAGFQTYQMFVASWVPSPSSNHAIHQAYATTRPVPTSTAGIIVRKMDDLLNQLPSAISNSKVSSYFTTILVFLLMFLVLLVLKLTLGMVLLAFARSRYRSMKEREHTGNPSPYIEGSKRVGGWGTVEVDDEKRRVIYEDDPAALAGARAKEAKDKVRKQEERDRGYSAEGLEKIKRYELGTSKRIW